MNTKTKKLIFIFTVLLAGIALMSSCSKEPESGQAKQQQTKGAKKAKKASAEIKTAIPPAGENTFTAIRNGPHVNLAWHVDASVLAGVKLKQIYVMRSLSDQKAPGKVAELEPVAVSFQDTLPSEYAYWYWLRLVREDGKFQNIGPVKVNLDTAGPSAYVKQADKYKTSITRTDDVATIKWDFPADEYKEIALVRHSRPGTGPYTSAGKRVDVLKTVERKSQCTNVLPDPNSEYWYWFRITLKTGQVIDKGPIKAEYTGK